MPYKLMFPIVIAPYCQTIGSMTASSVECCLAAIDIPHLLDVLVFEAGKLADCFGDDFGFVQSIAVNEPRNIRPLFLVAGTRGEAFFQVSIHPVAIVLGLPLNFISRMSVPSPFFPAIPRITNTKHDAPKQDYDEVYDSSHKTFS